MRLFLATLVVGALAGCASAQPSNPPFSYVRADGGPVNVARARATLAQCQREAAARVGEYVTDDGPIPWAAGMVSRAQQLAILTNDCMVRNGYMLAQ